MPHVEFDLQTRLPPEQVVAALTDFSSARPERWPNIDPAQYRVYDVQERWADVREGSRMGPFRIWAREHYEWSQNKVTWVATESSFCKPGSYMSARIGPADDGGSNLHVVWEREPASLLGRAITRMVTMTRGKPLKRDLQKALDAQAGRASSARRH